MVKFLFFVCILIVGCAQLSRGQAQPVITLDRKENILATNCGGAVETWGTCFQKANETCKNGFKVLEKEENSTGTSRKLTFKCK